MIFTSKLELPEPSLKRELLLLVVVNQAVAVLLMMLGLGGGNIGAVILANCIGFAIAAINALLCAIWPRVRWNWRTPAAALPGLLLGFAMARLLGEPDYLKEMLVSTWSIWAMTFVVLLTGCSFFALFYRNTTFRYQLERAHRLHAEAKRGESEAKLAMLQAQIEPHFLFNTLANVHSLIARNAPLAQTLLEHLNDYLRASLARTRQPQTTLACELELIRALLAISAIRLGRRLSYQIEVPQALHAAQLPPLLLQPLVENALEHGIEPSVSGGEIVIRASRSGAQLTLSVTDSGVGVPGTMGEGVGLTNVRARLDSLYGPAGRLTLQAGRQGFLAEIELPYSESPV
ncbi:sensor histidine kinase [Chitinibacteraceae bacterium HSL-7]